MCAECQWEIALETADEITDMIEDLPDEANAFAASIEDLTSNIRAWITEHEHVTDKQVNSLENMHRGAEKWLQD